MNGCTHTHTPAIKKLYHENEPFVIMILYVATDTIQTVIISKRMFQESNNRQYYRLNKYDNENFG